MTAQLEPLIVTLETRNSGIVSYDLPNLGGILSYAVMTEATQRLVFDDRKIYYVPLPVMRLWSSPDGLPLWATSNLFPLEGIETPVIMHQRFLHPTRTGRMMDKRIPKPTTVAWEWKAHCFGEKAEIERLLAQIDSVGKHRHDGLGLVYKWTIESAEFSPWDTICFDGALIAPFPLMALDHASFTPVGGPSLVAWTQPFWKRQLFNYGWRVGAQTEQYIDFYDAM